MAAVEKTNLCIAGFRLFGACWREWLKTTIWFFAALTIVGILAYDPVAMEALDKIHDAQANRQPLTQEQVNALKVEQEARAKNEQLTPDQVNAVKQVHEQMNAQLKESQEHLHAVWQMIMPRIWTVPLILLVSLIQYFVYTVLFLKSPPVFDAPVLNASRFLYMLWKILQKFLVMAAIGLLSIGIPVVIGVVLAKMKFGLGFLPFVLGAVGVVFLYYVLIRYVLVVPLAVSGTGPALITSWRMTKGSWWRIFGNVLLFAICLLIATFVAQLVEKGIISFLMTFMPSVFGTVTEPPVRHFVISDVVGFLSVIPRHVQGGIAPYIGVGFASMNVCVVYGFSAAFYCAIVRTLRQEQK